MSRSVSAVLILSLLATVVVPVWASQPAPVKHTASLSAAQAADDGWQDKWRGSKIVGYVRAGCVVMGLSALVSKGAACAGPILGTVCGACAVFAAIDLIAGLTGD